MKKYRIKKPFTDSQTGRERQVGERYIARSPLRTRDLLDQGLIEETAAKNIPAAPRNKDAAPQRQRKRQ